MTTSARLFLTLICSACLMTTAAINADARGGGGHGGGDHARTGTTAYAGNANSSGAAKRPTSASDAIRPTRHRCTAQYPCPGGPTIHDHRTNGGPWTPNPH